MLAYWERDPLKILPNLAEVKPHYFPSVPRIFEKIYTAATSKAEKAGGVQKRDLRLGDRASAVACASSSARARARGRRFASSTQIADRLVLSHIRNLFGGRIIEAVTGAAPINPEILRFFDAAGVLVVEGWGMTETSTAATISTAGGVQVRDDRQAVPGLRGEDRRRRRDPGAGPERLPGLLQERGGDPRDAGRRLAAHGRPRRDRRRRLHQDHRPQEGHHHHRRAARTSPRRTSRPRSSSTRWSPSAS